ncbi:MAG: DUF1998 domain-containing protein [Acidobacteria bacterium]|nr:DUF1998 domain-containing protein [Acidobacteriota bacterium]
MSRKGPIRRAQLIAPFGVGAMVVVRDGTSVVCGGLDHWYKREGGSDPSKPIDIEEYQVEEWRLQRQLKVSHFRLPPDYRNNAPQGEKPFNYMLTVPFLRFPQWHFCPSRGCKRLYELPLSMRERKKCDACMAKRKTRYVLQVPFVAICDRGHLQDFPWREWVHKTASPSCQMPMRLVSTGGASLAAQKIVCDCGKERSLASITTAGTDGSFLSRNLDESRELYLCQGRRPWLGDDSSEPCGEHLRGSLRSASNVYFAQMRSAIYLPRGTNSVPPALVGLLEEPPLSTNISFLIDSGYSVEPAVLRKRYPDAFALYTDGQIREALEIVTSSGEDDDGDAGVPGDDYQTAFLRAEFEVLRTPRREPQLMIEAADLSKYGPVVTRHFSRVMLVHKLRETRALAGFTRVVAETSDGLDRLKTLMWKNAPQYENSWLPAYIVFGEGIFLELDEGRLQKWELGNRVVERIASLAQRDQQTRSAKGLPPRPVSPRYVLLHTLAHLLMNRLTFECGYSSASLRERLFVSANPSGPMAGILIYTAAGDAEGTMGGLVRMGKSGYLEPVIQRALDAASWCSADPVCMEMGSSGGQGPESCNLAACHNCALVPETACERFNRYLDRALVSGSLDDQGLGYFEL